jgi:hypothetical protein
MRDALFIKTIRKTLTSVQNLDARIKEKLNIYMKQFRATVRAGGLVVTTIVFAENVNFATKILQAQFGANNVISIPTQIGNG